MRAAIITESLPPVVDGVARTLTRLCETMERDGVDFRLVTPVRPGSGFPWADRVVPVASMPLALHDCYRVGLPWAQGLGRRLGAWQPDIVHLTSPTPLNSFAAHWARRHDVPVVSSYHTHFVRYLRYYGLRGAERFGWRYLRWFHNQGCRTFAPSPSAVRELTARGIRGASLWGRGINLAHFSPVHRDPDLRASVGASDAAPLLLYVGRLVREKDLDDLVAARDRLAAQGTPHRLVLVGDGPMRADLAHQLPDAVFTGTVSGAGLSRWFASADVFVFPSTTETFGNVVLEAAASGVPAVVVRSGGVTDVVQHGVTGLVADANDPEDLARQITQLLANPELAAEMGRRARALARSRDWSEVNRALLAQWSEVVEEASVRRAA